MKPNGNLLELFILCLETTLRLGSQSLLVRIAHVE